jgi:hypothetical protein
LLIVNEHHLRRVLTEYLLHYSPAARRSRLPPRSCIRAPRATTRQADPQPSPAQAGPARAATLRDEKSANAQVSRSLLT